MASCTVTACQLPLQGLETGLDGTEQLAPALGQVGQPGEAAPDLGGILLIEKRPHPFAAAGHVGEAQLAGQRGPLALETGAGGRHLPVEFRESPLGFGKFPAGGVERLAGARCGRFGLAQLLVELAAPGPVLAGLLLEIPDAIPHFREIVLRLARALRGARALFWVAFWAAAGPPGRDTSSASARQGNTRIIVWPV